MVERCGLQSITPSANVVYDEIWKPAASPTDSFAYNYQQLTTRDADEPELLPGLVADLPHHHSLRHHRRSRRATSIRCGRCRGPPPASTDPAQACSHIPQTCTDCHNRARCRRRGAIAGRFARARPTKSRTRMRCSCEPIGSCCSRVHELELVDGRRGAAPGSGSAGCQRQPDHHDSARCRHRWRRAMRAARGSSA